MTNPLPLKRQKHIKLEDLPEDALQEIRSKEQQSAGVMDEHMVDLGRIKHAEDFTPKAKKELFNMLVAAMEEAPIVNNKKIKHKAKRTSYISNDSKPFSPAHMVAESSKRSSHEESPTNPPRKFHKASDRLLSK